MNETMPAPAATALSATNPKVQTLGGCALLIGVETYDEWGPEQQLRAGRNDVLAYWKVCRRLGYQPEHIRVLTSPMLTVQDIVWAEQELGPELDYEWNKHELHARVKDWFEDGLVDHASRCKIVEGVTWLARQLVYKEKIGGGREERKDDLAALPGLLTYSGHGAHNGEDLMLCPSDVDQGLKQALSFQDLRKLIDAHKAEGTPDPADNLTVVLDCCFAAAADKPKEASRVRTLALAGSGSAPTPRQEIGNRVFCASGRAEQAYQAMLGGYWYGAFTWALTVALEQWTIASSGGFAKSTISHTELLFRTRMLLEALSFPQHPMLVDRIGNLPVFQHDGDVERETSAEPDAERLGGQIDPSDGAYAYYEFVDDQKNVLAKVIATNTAENRLDGLGMEKGMEKRREYWKICGDKFKSCMYKSISVLKTTYKNWSNPRFTKEESDFSCLVDMPWCCEPGSGCYHQHRSVEQKNPSGFHIDIWFDRNDSKWKGDMVFYRKAEAGLLFENLPEDAPECYIRGSYTHKYQCRITSKDITTLGGEAHQR